MDNLLLKELSNDRALASAILFPHRHRQTSPMFHFKLFDLWSSADELVSIEAFRQGAKTTLSEEFLLTEALFSNFKYCLIFGETYTKACQRIEAMKHEINTNQKLTALFGNMKGIKWSENKIVLANGVAIEAHGWEEEIRGYLHMAQRPDRAYLDDIETEESVRSSEVVDVNWKKLHKQLLPAMDKDFGKVRMTGTPLADDCMIRRAANSKNWTHGRFPICNGDIDDPNAQSLWEERYPMEWIRQKRDQMAEEGMLREFMQEYMLVPTGAYGKPFNESHLHFEDVAPQIYAPRVAIVDPARTANVKTSDQTGYVVASRIGTRIYIHESGGEYLQPDEIVSKVFELSARHDDCDAMVEKDSLDNWMTQPIRAEMMRTGKSLKFRAMNAPKDRNKQDFIMGLRPFFIAGDIILVGGRAKHQNLVSQILNFPTGKRDVLNALAYTLRAFSGVPVYGEFVEANIARDYSPAHNAQLLLTVNASGSDTAAVLCAYDGTYLSVLADWISPFVPSDCIPDIVRLVRAVYPGKQITAWVPADVYDQEGRNPIVTALKTMQIKANRAEYATMSRGSLTPFLRTEIRGRRALVVADTAKNVMSAMAGGYNWPVKSTGERAAEPERNADRILIEALECLTSAINAVQNTHQLVQPNATNAAGRRYISALPR